MIHGYAGFSQPAGSFILAICLALIIASGYHVRAGDKRFSRLLTVVKEVMRNRRSPGFNLGPIGYLVVTNLILYIATSINDELIRFFGLQPANFWTRPWTIVTNLFIHDPFPGIWHILANLITLYFFGSNLIRLVGERRFLITYFCGGILGNAFFILYAFLFEGLSVNAPYMLQISTYSIAIGASGAVFAVAGALTVMSPRTRVFIIPIPVPMPLWVAVIGGCLIISFFPYVAWQAHLGGLVFGLIMGYFFRKRRRRFF